jgi:hypothetical protein
METIVGNLWYLVFFRLVDDEQIPKTQQSQVSYAIVTARQDVIVTLCAYFYGYEF